MKNPVSWKERKRLKRIEKIEKTRYKIIEFFVNENGKSDAERKSLREIAGDYGYSHTHIRKLRDKCLDCRKYVKDNVPMTVYKLKKGVKELIKLKPRGPAKGQYTPVQDSIEEVVLETKEKYKFLGAAKIGAIAGVKAAPKTVHTVLRKNGYPNVTMRKGKVYKPFEMKRTNEMWQIDFVELGKDRITGKSVEFLSVIDDKSRFMMNDEPCIYATTDAVLGTLEGCFVKYGIPEKILSDHGTQWCANNGGDTRFDAFCNEWGIKHIMGQVRKPTTQGKVERWHGSIRREAGLPEEYTLEEYASMMREYVHFYNFIRPHWSCGLRTPFTAFYEGHESPVLLANLIQ